MTFGFYGQPYSGLTFSDDGFLVYGTGNYAGQPWVPQSVPSEAKPNSIAALLWQDMELRYDAGTGAGVSLASTGPAVGDVAIVEYDDIRLVDDAAGANGKLDMEVFATSGSNDLVFAYDNVTPGTILQGVTIGTENAAATAGAALVNAGDATTVVEDDLVVCAAYSEPAAQGASFSYQVTVTDEVHNRQELVNEAVHTTDDPGAKPATASATVDVTGARELSDVALTLDPTTIETGETTTATATVTSEGATPTGTVTFKAGSRVAGTAPVGPDGTASATLTGFGTAGVVPVTATYSGDEATFGATSDPVNLRVTATPAPPKVKPKVRLDAPKQVKTGQKVTVKVEVDAAKLTPTGKVKITVKAPGKKAKTYTVTLGRSGKASVGIGSFGKAGKVTIEADYLGDAAVKPGSDKTTVKVVAKKKRRG